MKDTRDDPSTEWHQRLQAAARKALTEDDIREIVQGLVEDAKKGNRVARQMVLGFLQLQQPAAAKGPPALQQPAQQIKANVVNVYAGGKRRKKPKLIDVAGNGAARMIGHRNGD